MDPLEVSAHRTSRILKAFQCFVHIGSVELCRSCCVNSVAIYRLNKIKIYPRIVMCALAGPFKIYDVMPSWCGYLKVAAPPVIFLFAFSCLPGTHSHSESGAFHIVKEGFTDRRKKRFGI